jgi:hypothetical protein
VGRARECELLAPPPARVEASGFHEREELKRLCAGAPHGEEVGVAGAAQDFPLIVADDRVHAVSRLDRVSARGDYIEIITNR